MNTLPVMLSLTMTSREIAELTGKRHDHVLRDIRDMITQVHDLQDNPDFGYLSIQGVTIDQDKGRRAERDSGSARRLMCLKGAIAIALHPTLLRRDKYGNRIRYRQIHIG